MDELNLTVIPRVTEKVTLTLNKTQEGIEAVLQGFSNLDELEELSHNFLSALAELNDERPGALEELILSGLIADKLDRLTS